MELNRRWTVERMAGERSWEVNRVAPRENRWESIFADVVVESCRFLGYDRVRGGRVWSGELSFGDCVSILIVVSRVRPPRSPELLILSA